LITIWSLADPNWYTRDQPLYSFVSHQSYCCCAWHSVLLKSSTSMSNAVVFFMVTLVVVVKDG
jgi:hypothetical protein